MNPPLHTAETPLFELRSSPIQGTGAFAITSIPKGTRIIEYMGEKISNAEADRRYDDEKMSRHHTFLFTLNSRYVVDAAVGGNEARFINHSCAPNCEAVIERGHIYIEALEDIPYGAELAYDYAYERSDDHSEDDEDLYLCRCGAAECRGTILAPPPKRRKRRKQRAAVRKSSKKRTLKSTRKTKRSTKRGSRKSTMGTRSRKTSQSVARRSGKGSGMKREKRRAAR